MGEYKPREKKYTLVVDMTDYNIDIIDELIKDVNGPQRLCSGTYTITTNGGKGKVWKVKLGGGPIFTVSSQSLRSIKVNKFVSVPEYLHYVLTPEGIAYVKQLVVEKAI